MTDWSGFTTVIYTEVVQSVVLLFGGLILAILALREVRLVTLTHNHRHTDSHTHTHTHTYTHIHTHTHTHTNTLTHTFYLLSLRQGGTRTWGRHMGWINHTFTCSSLPPTPPTPGQEWYLGPLSLPCGIGVQIRWTGEKRVGYGCES